MFPSPRTCLRIWFRETGSAVPSRVSLLISILFRLNLVLTYGITPEFHGGRCSFMKPPYAIGSVPSLSGWRSLPRVRRYRASKPQGISSERVLRWQVTMDQLICASLSHTHYWYEVDMLEVPTNNIMPLIVSPWVYLVCTRIICAVICHPSGVLIIIIMCVCVCVCFLPIHTGHQVPWTYQPGSHRRKVTQDF